MSWWHYILLVNIYLCLFYGFYILLLRNETFFQLNRIYLVAASVLSFFIPVIQSDWVKDLFITKEVQLTIYNSPLVVYRFTPIQHTQLTFGDILAAAYIVGMLFLIGRFIWQMIALNKIFREPVSDIAFSFFKKIKLGEKHADNHVIAAHEHVHAKQWHSADVLLIEAVMIVNWFNPVVYLYRYTIKHIHEYIADSQAVKTGTDKSEYALLLVSQTFNAPAHKLVNPFYNHSLLKQRIIMLQKNRSNHMALVKYGLSAPLFMLMLVLSSATVYNSKTVGFVNKKVDQVLLAPATQSTLVLNTANTIQNTPASAIESKPVNIETAPLAKNTTAPDEGLSIFTSVEQVPQFVGGIDAFYRYLSQNIKYPVNAREAGIQGKVIVSFIVEKDGSLSDARIARSVSPEIDDEALRVIIASPDWKPGIQNGRQVRVAYSVPISFTLVNNYKPGVAPMFLPAGQNGKVPALRLNTTPTKTDTLKKMPFDLKDLPANPLYLYNGKEVSDISGLNPDNIESISVLRDKNATALYGAKGSGGVVIITSRSKSLFKSQLPLLLPKDVEKH